MLDFHIIHGITDYLSINQSPDTLNHLFWHSSVNWQVLAQEIKDPKVLDQMQNAWKYFISSGQVWALGIGLFLGYWIRGVTA